MEFEKLSLTQYRCFEDESVEFEPGVTVVYGRNGAGKSTVLEACFFGLYGSDALREEDSTLEDVLMNDKQTASVRLRFRHEDSVYTVTREVRERSGRVTQAVCELDTPTETLSGATDVDQKIQSLIRMDATAFLNCAYVQQGNIQKLINASSDQRRDLIDRLLQLGRLETYRERASDVRVGVGRVRDTKRSLLEDRADTISDIESERPYEKLSDLNQQIGSLQSDIDDLQSVREGLCDERDEAQATVEAQEEIKDEIDTLDGKIDSHETEITELREQKAGLAEQIQAQEDKITTTTDELHDTLDATTYELPSVDIGEVSQLETSLSSLREKNTELTEAIASTKSSKSQKRDTVNRLDGEMSDAEAEISTYQRKVSDIEQRLHNTLRPEYEDLTEQIEEATMRIEELEAKITDHDITVDNIDERQDELSTQRDELMADTASFRADEQAAKQELDRATTLKSEGMCPECGQSVEGSPHVDRIGELRATVKEHHQRQTRLAAEMDRVDSALEDIDALSDAADSLEAVRSEKKQTEKLRAKQKQTITDAEDSISETRQEIESTQQQAEEWSEQRDTRAEELSTLTDTLDDQQNELASITEQTTLVKQLLDIHTTHDEALAELDSLQTEVKHKEELITQQQKTINSLQSDRESVSTRLSEDELDAALSRLDSVSDDIADTDNSIDELEDELGAAQQRKGQVGQTISRLESLEKEHERLKDELEAVNDLYGQMESVEDMYSTLRGDLRQENVRKLELLLNEMFDIVYQNDAYDRITLDGQYNASVVQKNSQELAPSKLSGGESALFNLSLRCAIYQLLVQGVGGTGLMPPLIFDEPTAHLDQGHVNQIDDIVRRMRDIGVEQTIVVSHDDEIIGSSNHRVHVEKKQASNHSRISVDSAIQL